MLTHEQMRKIILEGGSVLYQGQVISRVESLPSPAMLAKGDPAKEQEAAHNLQQQIKQLQAELAQLREESYAAMAAPEGQPLIVNGIAIPETVNESESEAPKPKKAASKKAADPSADDQESDVD